MHDHDNLLLLPIKNSDCFSAALDRSLLFRSFLGPCRRRQSRDSVNYRKGSNDYVFLPLEEQDKLAEPA